MLYTLKIHLIPEVNYYPIKSDIFVLLLISCFILLLVWISFDSPQTLYLCTFF